MGWSSGPWQSRRSLRTVFWCVSTATSLQSESVPGRPSHDMPPPRPLIQNPELPYFIFIEENYQKYWIFLPKYGKMKKAVITKQKGFVK